MSILGGFAPFLLTTAMVQITVNPLKYKRKGSKIEPDLVL
jgi:hypothetical protein